MKSRRRDSKPKIKSEREIGENCSENCHLRHDIKQCQQPLAKVLGFFSDKIAAEELIWGLKS